MGLIKRFDKNLMRKKRFTLRKGLEILPHIFTLGNGFFGFLSIVFSSQTDFIGAAYFILLGALMDLLDGRVARLAGTTSELGMQLDSLCDAISFCVAPAFLVYSWELYKFGVIGLMSCAFFLLAGVLRLARFNITSNEQSIYFLGVPTTIAGCFLATLLLNLGYTYRDFSFLVVLSVLMVCLGILMISTIRFPTFKHIKKGWSALVILGFIAVGVVMGFTNVILLLFLMYFIFSFARSLWYLFYKLKNPAKEY